MKTTPLVLVGVVFAAVSGLGAAEPPPERNPLARMEALRGKLGLSEEQWEKLQPLLKQEGEKVREILSDASLSQEQKRAKAKEATMEGRKQFTALLTPEQREKLAVEMKNRPGRLGGPVGDQGQRMAELKQKLELSDEQVEKLKPVLAEEGPKLRALREDKDRTPEERRAAFEASFERIASGLTDVQREKLREEMRARRP